MREKKEPQPTQEGLWDADGAGATTEPGSAHRPLPWLYLSTANRTWLLTEIISSSFCLPTSLLAFFFFSNDIVAKDA